VILLISAAAFILLTLAISSYGYRVYARPGRVFSRLDQGPLGGSVSAEGGARPTPNPLAELLRQIGEKVPVSPESAVVARRYLVAAGFRSESALPILYGCKVLAGVALVLAGLSMGSLLMKSPNLRMLVPLAAGFAGWSLPGVVLDRLMARRQERLRHALPDALDLMVVCVEGGIGLDQAFVTVSRDLRVTHKDICDEFTLVNLEMRAGKRRSDALHNLAERTGEPELKKLVAVLVQADRFGTSVAESLRTHADFMRVRRRQDAEERAAKVSVKLVFPIFFCILPAMMIVTGGPGVLQVLKFLVPMLKNVNK